MSATTISPGLVERTTTLSVFTLLAFLGNLLLLVTIGQSAALRQTHFNKHIINVAILNLLTAIVGLPMVIGYSVTSQWDYGEKVTCKVFAHFLLSTMICMCLSILAMNIDRVVAIVNPDLYAIRITSAKTVLLLLSVWLVAILFPLPLSLGTVPTSPYPARYVCTISAGSSLSYLIPLYSICFGLPALVNILMFIYITREAMSEKEAESRGTMNRPGSTVRLWPEVQTAGVVFILFLVWMISELPYVFLTSIDQYISSSEINQVFHYAADIDTTFMWLKFCNSFALPFIIFKWRKDIWQKFKDLIFCRKRNSIIDASPRPDNRSYVKPKPKPQVQQNNAGDTPKFHASFPIPTIKASKEGLHVHGNTDDVEADDEIFYADLNITGTLDHLDKSGTVERNLPTQDAEGELEDTSDYETDPYSQSDPISVRSSVSASRHSRTASGSTTAASKEFRTKANSISVISQDSGNGSASSSVKKKRRKKRAVADMHIENARVSASTQDVRQAEPVEYNEPQLPATSPDDLLAKQGTKSKDVDVPKNNGDVIESLETDVSKPMKRKKKKKKKNKGDIIDAETNTTQTINMEMVERIVPPPRLSPLDPDVIQKSMSSMATPPLRGKVPRERDLELLPPTGRQTTVSRDDQHGERQSATLTDSSKSKHRKRKSPRPRNKSGDSEKPLMSSNASSELQGASTERLHDSYM